jgi:hypothetical protein
MHIVYCICQCERKMLFKIKIKISVILWTYFITRQNQFMLKSKSYTTSAALVFDSLYS